MAKSSGLKVTAGTSEETIAQTQADSEVIRTKIRWTGIVCSIAVGLVGIAIICVVCLTAKAGEDNLGKLLPWMFAVLSSFFAWIAGVNHGRKKE
jgi:hypothetical protein